MSKNNGEEQEPKEKSEDILDKTKQDDSKNKKEDITKIKTKEEIKTKNNKKSLWLIILFSVLVVFLLVISVIFALININNEKIFYHRGNHSGRFRLRIYCLAKKGQQNGQFSGYRSGFGLNQKKLH